MAFSLRYGYGANIVHNQVNDTTTDVSGIKRCLDNPSFIDCGTNEELFLALAALRDDSNDHQWFVWDLEKGEKDMGDRWKLYDDNPDWNWWIFECHKATIKELKEHFK